MYYFQKRMSYFHPQIYNITKTNLYFSRDYNSQKRDDYSLIFQCVFQRLNGFRQDRDVLFRKVVKSDIQT